MSVGGVDPGAGEPAAIRGMGLLRRAKAVELRGVCATVTAAQSTVTGSVWSGKARGAFMATLDQVTPDLVLLADGLEAQAAALLVYAGEVAQIKDAQLRLQARRETAQDALVVARRGVVSQLEQDVMLLAGAEGGAALARVRRAEETILAETSVLRQVQSEWDLLVARRRRADDVCVTALTGPDTLGKTASFLGTSVAAVTPNRLLMMLDGLSATDLAVVLQTHPGLSAKLAAATPGAVAAWWAGLNGPVSGTPSAAQAALIAALPAVIGNLGGVAYWARDTANRIVLTERIAAARKAVADTKAALPWGGLGGAGTGVGTNWASDDYLHAKQRLDALGSIDRALQADADGTIRALVSLTDDIPPLAAVAIGDLDIADNVTFTVPGMGTDATSMVGWADVAHRLRAQQILVSDRDLDAAVVAWIGYDAPRVPMSPEVNLDVFGDERAKAGASNLARDLQSWNAVRAGEGASLNIVAHSYGTTTAAYALAGQDMNVEAFVSLGSAGIPSSIATASDLLVGRVYAGQAQDVIPALEEGDGDQWAWLGRWGSDRQNPIDPAFGATRFGTNGNLEMELRGVTDHSTSPHAPEHGYLDNQTEALHNVALATTNQPERMTAHVNPGLTEKQRLIVDGPWKVVSNGQ
jgi:hypothetical protein